MAGNTRGGKKSAATNISLYGKSFYSDIGKIGGAASNTGGFYGNPELASRAGRLGGSISRRGDTPKPSKKQVSDIRKRLLEEQSQMQTTKLSQKHGAKRPW